MCGLACETAVVSSPMMSGPRSMVWLVCARLKEMARTSSRRNLPGSEKYTSRCIRVYKQWWDRCSGPGSQLCRSRYWRSRKRRYRDHGNAQRTHRTGLARSRDKDRYSDRRRHLHVDDVAHVRRKAAERKDPDMPPHREKDQCSSPDSSRGSNPGNRGSPRDMADRNK